MEDRGWTLRNSSGISPNPPKHVALVASMRKVLVMLNAMLEHGYPWYDMTQPVVAHAC